ncbi:MAG TPA: DUF4129 domain-containing protein [Terracidiphilus sp.]|nr:DUF4129 domain-containing protein [Terracidiphilus sp.]
MAAAFALPVLFACVAFPARAQQIPSNAGLRDVTVAQFQQHLSDLATIVVACKAQWSQKPAVDASNAKFPACDPAQIGPDNRVHGLLGTDSREVRYDWLRSVLARAANKNEAAGKSVFGAMSHSNAKQVPVESLLDEAGQRLRNDAAQAGSPLAPAPDFSSEKKTLNSILSQRAYRGVTQVSAMDRLSEWIDNLLDRFFGGLVRFGSHTPWIVWLLRILLAGGIATALIWFFLRIERRSRVKLVPDLETAPGAPSARDWQLWYKDASAMATQARWREAIHFLYWASISLLESKRLWPADRARTPREYLALVASSDPRKTNLTALTRSFERTWYGGREATASDFNAALDVVRALGVPAE